MNEGLKSLREPRDSVALREVTREIISAKEINPEGRGRGSPEKIEDCGRIKGELIL